MPAATAAPPAERTICLLDYDPELGRSIRPQRRAEARASAIAPVVVVPRGAWDAQELAQGDTSPYGLLLLDGLVSRTVLLGDVAATQLLGRGDLITPGEEPADALVPAPVRWNVLEPVSVAVLDERFLLSVRRWPEIVAALFERVAAQARRVGTHRALCHLPRVEDRIHALLWFLAERWGRMTPQGVILPLRLTHDMLGQLVGAKRPTVSLAIKELATTGRVHRRADGAWLLEQAWERGEAVEIEPAAVGSFLVEEAPEWAAEPAGAGAPASVMTETAPEAPPAPELPHDRLSDVRVRLERLRAVHELAIADAREAVARSLAMCERSAALQERFVPPVVRR